MWGRGPAECDLLSAGVALGSAKLPSKCLLLGENKNRAVPLGPFPLISFSYLLGLSHGVVFKTTSPVSQWEAGLSPGPGVKLFINASWII